MLHRYCSHHRHRIGSRASIARNAYEQTNVAADLAVAGARLAKMNAPAKAGGTRTAFCIKERLLSFRYAGAGIGFMLRTQHNAWIHLFITLVVCLAGAWLQLSADDWRWLTVSIVLVWVAETMNTAFEYLCDVVSPDFHTSVAKAKDIAAAAVLICAAGAAVLGLLTFWPYVTPWR